MCSVTVTGSADQPTITWLSPTNTLVGNVNTLTFNPLTASDAGRYTCRATLGSEEQTEDVNVIVMSECSIVALSGILCDLISHLSDPSITVSVSGDVAPVARMMLTLTCNVDGADMITNPTITYQWFRDGMVVSDQTQQTWSFSSLAYTDAGQYSCAVNISSTILPSTITAIADPFNVTLSCESCCRNIASVVRITDKICL